MTTHPVEVVRIKMEPHPNADRLSLVRIGGYQVVVNKSDWKDGDLGAYIEPDSLVPTGRQEFSFLSREGRDTERITVRRFRGQWSEGLLVKAPPGSTPGDDVAAKLGVTHYEPEAKIDRSSGGRLLLRQRSVGSAAPSGRSPVYDLDNLKRDGWAFTPGELVLVTEKIHGCNARFTYRNGKFYAGSHRCWRPSPVSLKGRWWRIKDWFRRRSGDDKQYMVEQAADPWWGALESTPGLRDMLKDNPDWTVYGEIYGQVQEGFDYGVKDGVRLAVFDIWSESCWLQYSLRRSWFRYYGVPLVPELGLIPFDEDTCRELAEGQSMLGGDHVREGIVIESLDRKKKMKLVGNGYLEAKK